MVGINLVSENLGSNLVGNGTAPVTMRVFADQDGSLSLELVEPNTDNVYAVTETVAAGWNNVSFDLSGAPAGPDWSKAVLRPDATDDGNAFVDTTTTYYIDDVHFPLAVIETVGSIPGTPTTGVVYGFDTDEEGLARWDGVYAGREYVTDLDGTERSARWLSLNLSTTTTSGTAVCSWSTSTGSRTWSRTVSTTRSRCASTRSRPVR